MSRTILFVSARDPEAAARVVAESPVAPKICLVSPTDAACRTASIALEGHAAFIAAEPLLAPRALDESGDDVAARLAHALRIVEEHDADPVLVVLDHVEIPGTSTPLP